MSSCVDHCFTCNVEFEDIKHERSEAWNGISRNIDGNIRYLCRFCSATVPYVIVQVACGEREDVFDHGFTYDEKNWMTHPSIRNVGSCAGGKPSVSKKDYPNICPRCGAPAYLGLTTVDCSKCGGF